MLSQQLRMPDDSSDDDSGDSGSSLIEEIPSGPLRAFAIRLEPDDDLMEELQEAVTEIMEDYAPAAFVLSCTGNLSMVTLELGQATSILYQKKKKKEKSKKELPSDGG